MRATWLTPDVIRATARAIQLEERLPNADVQRLVAEARARPPRWEILFGPRATDVELVVNIRGQEGVGSWPVPASVRQRIGSR